MTGAEMRAAREALGLSGPWVAEQLGVSLRTVRRWERSEEPLGSEVSRSVEVWLDDAEWLEVDAVIGGRALETPYPDAFYRIAEHHRQRRA